MPQVSASSNPPPGEPAKGLPPVAPPSGRHIVQLFLVPGLIVAGAVTILLGFSWLAGGARTPDQFLKNLDSANSDIRWRAANDLAQVLKRDDKLAADPAFGLRLAERLSRALDELERVEKARASLPKTATDKEIATAHKELIAQRNYVQFLAAGVGNLSLPVGAPVLIDMARSRRFRDDKVNALVRRQGVWALANLGDGQKRFQRLTAEQKTEARRGLEAEIKTDNALSKPWAEAALAWIEQRKSLGVIAALAECAQDPQDMFLRVEVALALNFWDGDAAERQLAEQTLVQLTRDTGRGERIELKEGE